MSRLKIVQNGIIRMIETENGDTLKTSLSRAGIHIGYPCGGNGKCGKCSVKVILDDGRSFTVNACSTSIAGIRQVEIDDADSGGVIETAKFCEPQKNIYRHVSAAVDLGTTTIAAALVDTDTGNMFATAGAWNAQRSFGADVISRMDSILKERSALEKQRDIIRAQVSEMLERMCEQAEVDVNRLEMTAIAGNTVMQHIFAGIDPTSMAVSPFIPVSLFEDINVYDYGYKGLFRTVFAPCVAAFVGGDITAGLLSTGLDEKQGKYLFMDIGTNGEMAIGGKNGFICCSVASGPAFEGAEIKCGMSSLPGAISQISIQKGIVSYTTVDNVQAKGICGSALIDALAQMMECGIMDETGLICSPDDTPTGYENLVTEDDDGNGVLKITSDGSIYICQEDVRKLQLAKAAVAAGIKMLLGESKMEPEEVNGLIIAGGFGKHINAASAAIIGMIPEALVSKCVFVGNSSLEGTAKMLYNSCNFNRLLDIKNKSRYVELSGNGRFNELFIDSMYFGNGDN